MEFSFKEQCFSLQPVYPTSGVMSLCHVLCTSTWVPLKQGNQDHEDSRNHFECVRDGSQPWLNAQGRAATPKENSLPVLKQR